jgi:hypothetical protein
MGQSDTSPPKKASILRTSGLGYAIVAWVAFIASPILLVIGISLGGIIRNPLWFILLSLSIIIFLVFPGIAIFKGIQVVRTISNNIQNIKRQARMRNPV